MDKRSITSALNGKKGGRKKGYASIAAEKARELLCKELDKEWKPIVIKAIQQAKDGDAVARNWLSERGYGKVAQAIVTENDEGERLPITGMVITSDGDTV